MITVYTKKYTLQFKEAWYTIHLYAEGKLNFFKFLLLQAREIPLTKQRIKGLPFLVEILTFVVFEGNKSLSKGVFA